MSLASQAVQRIDSRGLNLNERALLRCQLAKELEDSGNYEAARGAMGETQSLIQALRKLSKKNLSNLTPHPLYSSFYYSHPTLLERERALRMST